MSIHKYMSKESGNISLGQVGSKFTDDKVAVTGLNIVAIDFIEDTTFTTLTPLSSSFPGTSGGNGNNIDTSNVFPMGKTMFGNWTGYELASGTIIAYYG